MIFCSLFLHFAFGQVSSQLLQALRSKCATSSSVAEYQCTRPQELQTTRVVVQTTRPETTKALQCDQMGSVFVSDRRGCGKHVSKTFSNSTKLFCKQGALMFAWVLRTPIQTEVCVWVAFGFVLFEPCRWRWWWQNMKFFNLCGFFIFLDFFSLCILQF